MFPHKPVCSSMFQYAYCHTWQKPCTCWGTVHFNPHTWVEKVSTREHVLGGKKVLDNTRVKCSKMKENKREETIVNSISNITIHIKNKITDTGKTKLHFYILLQSYWIYLSVDYWTNTKTHFHTGMVCSQPHWVHGEYIESRANSNASSIEVSCVTAYATAWCEVGDQSPQKDWLGNPVHQRRSVFHHWSFKNGTKLHKKKNCLPNQPQNFI